MSAAITFQQERDWQAVRAACHQLAIEARTQVAHLTDVPPITDASTAWWSQMCLLPLPPCDVLTLKTRLWDEYAVEIPLIDWRGRQFLRISVQCYNSPAQVERLVEGLKSIL